jgi:hypothetical protein
VRDGKEHDPEVLIDQGDPILEEDSEQLEEGDYEQAEDQLSEEHYQVFL